MPLIIISAEDQTIEETIARGVAKATGYECLGPDGIPEIAAEYHATEDNLHSTLEKVPATGISRNAKRWPYWLACVQAGMLTRLRADNMVCWGLSAHLYVQGVSHALRVRLLADTDQMAESLAQGQQIPLTKAKKALLATRRRREKWVSTAFDLDENDSSLYDLVINTAQIDADEAIAAIVKAVGYRKFKPMTYSINSLADLALAARARAALSQTMTDFRVQARDGRVVVTSKALKRERQKKAAAIKEIAGALPEVQYVEVHLINYVIRKAAENFG